MPDETAERMHQHVQMLAQGILIEWLLAAHFSRAKNPAKVANEMLASAEKIGAKMTFPEVGPEWSDLAAQEFRDFLMQHIHRAKALATGKPFDPTAFYKRVPDSNGNS